MAKLLTVLGGGAAALQWWQVAYRLQLFYRDYNAERGQNHIGAGDFTLIYAANAILLFAGAFASLALWRGSRGERRTAITVTIANLVAWLAVIYMHRTGILVGYDEFIRNWKQ